MTEQGRCETCKNGAQYFSDPDHVRCTKILEGMSGDYSDTKWSLHPIRDFGCIYHEPKPERNCGSCIHWGTLVLPASEDYFAFCEIKMGEMVRTCTTRRFLCDQWSERHG
jgi:hypothetical protein